MSKKSIIQKKNFFLILRIYILYAKKNDYVDMFTIRQYQFVLII